MIAPLEGWSWQLHEGGVALAPLDAPNSGSIGYIEEVRPLLGLAARVQSDCDRIGVEIVEMSPPLSFVTDEGEPAQLVEVTGTRQGRSVTLVVGHVLVDDFYSTTIAHVRRPAQSGRRFVEAVRALMRADAHRGGQIDAA